MTHSHVCDMTHLNRRSPPNYRVDDLMADVGYCGTRRYMLSREVCLLHTATHCNALQHTATHCSTLQRATTHCNTLQHTATHCNTLTSWPMMVIVAHVDICCRERYTFTDFVYCGMYIQMLVILMCSYKCANISTHI